MSYIDGTEKAMSILSPTDRAVLWRTVVTSGSEDRGSLLRVLSREVLDSVGRRLDLYEGHEDEVIETIELLDTSGLIGRDDLREAFEEADEDDEHAQAFAAILAGHLGEAADLERLGVEARVRAARLAALWQGHVLDRPRLDAEWLSASQVAARYGVTPQAVYKWIKSGRVQAEQTPGGSWRLPAEQFHRGRTDPRRLAALKAKLLEHAGDAPTVSDEELADGIVGRRQS
jgi:excisionase family DNA binding protein